MSAAPPTVADPGRPPACDSWVPYTLPIFAFLLLTSFESSYTATTPGDPGIPFPIAYAVKIVVVACLTAVSLFRFGLWRELAPLPRPGSLVLAAAVGLLVIVLWIGLDGLYPDLPFLGARTAYDPTALPAGSKWLFLSARMFGLVLLVPVFEELFWRSFLMRCFIGADYARVPVGKVTPFSAGATSACFAMAHPEWLPALLTGLLWSWLLYRTRSLGACVVSHLTANLALGLYVLYTHDWKYW